MPVDLDRSSGFGELSIATSQVMLQDSAPAPVVESPIVVLTTQEVATLQAAAPLTSGPSYQTQSAQDANTPSQAPAASYQPAALVVSSSNAPPVPSPAPMAPPVPSPAPMAPPASKPGASIPWWGWALGGALALLLVGAVVRRRRRRRA